MRITVVIPTYNEGENIGRFIEAVEEAVKLDTQSIYSFLIVDGNSPDGTIEAVKEKQNIYGNVYLLVEQKKTGLGNAYASGFKYAMKNLQPDVICEMDADFQHDPKDLPRLTKEIYNGYDYVIGSRFTKGGKIPKEWAFRRKFLSIGGNIFSKIVLGIFNVNDFTSGFKASRVKGFTDSIDLENILSAGFAYKLDLLFKMHKKQAKIKEIPISFGVRDRGDSKMEKNNAIDSLRVVLLLRYNENKNFFKFLAVGLIGLAVDTGLFNLFRILGVASNISALFSGAVAMFTTFMLNNCWSFKERQIEGLKKKITGIVVYVLSSSFPIIVRSWFVKTAVKYWGDTFVISNLAFFAGIVFGLIWNFTVYSRIIWRKKGLK